MCGATAPLCPRSSTSTDNSALTHALAEMIMPDGSKGKCRGNR